MSNIAAIVGRPNVGKSTLFNRLIGERKAIVDEHSGVTRDRTYGKSVWNGLEFTVIDSGGYIKGSDDVFESEIRKQVAWYELATNVTEKASFSFAPWGPPDDERFEPVAKSALNGAAAKKQRGRPVWWRCRFEAPRQDRPLILDLSGLSKGQVLLNGKNAGRYFVQTADGKPVPPHKELWLPECWLNENEQPNELLIFDESGFSPDKVKLGYVPIG